MEVLAPLGRFLFRFRGLVFTAIAVGALAFSTPKYLLGSASIDPWLDALGVVVSLLGLGVRCATIGFEYVVRGGRNRKVYADNLVQGGIYAHTRNPMYLGNALMVLGWALIVHSATFYFIALPLTVLFYAAIIAAEEEYLDDKFDAEFATYRARTNRILPRLPRLLDTLGSMRFNWRRVLVKDYNQIFLSVLFLAGLVFWDDYVNSGADTLPPLVHVLVFVVPWIALYLLVYVLKKTRRLDDDRPQEARLA